MAESFGGFASKGVDFLRGLARNNHRDWFQRRKEVFETALKEPMIALVEAINSHLLRFAPKYITDPKKAIYRIYRDTRFSKDKTPYKTHLAASFWRAGMEKHISAGFYFSVSPKQIEVAGGVYMPGPEQLRILRDCLATNHQQFRDILNHSKLKKLMGELWSEPMARMPKGFAPDHPAADLIRLKHWVLYDTRLDPSLVTTPRLLKEVVNRFELMTPMLEFLNQPLSVRPKDPLLIL
jgi:uncharacterized protein (TIGR02453 family)